MTAEPKFLRNAWYMAAWSYEVSETFLARRMFDTPILLFRKKEGGVSALTDRCPHRFAPLSRGERDGDTVICAYHGLTFNADGTCARSPFSERIPKNARVKSWPIVERDGIVWLWAGDAEMLDEASIPDFSIIHGGGPPISGYMAMAAHFEYGTDNLMDLSHIEFVHKGSFAGNGVIFAGKHSMTEDGAFIHSNWWMPDVAAPSHTQGIYPPDTRTDHWLDMRWQAPASMYLHIGATPLGTPREQGCIVHQAHILTPETATSAHYFWATTRSAPVVDEAMDKMLTTLMEQAFLQEDKPIIEAAFANLDGTDFWDHPPVSIGVDAGSTRARRKMQALLKAERAEE